jgi:hypothetical protein
MTAILLAVRGASRRDILDLVVAAGRRWARRRPR